MQESKSSGQHRPGLLLWAFGVVSAVVLSSTMYQDYPLVLDEHGSYWLLQSDIPSSLMQRSLDYAAIPPLSGWAEQLSMLLPIGREQAFRLPSMLCFCLGVALVGYVGLRFGDPVIAGLAAICLAWNPLALNEIRIARCYGLVVLESAALMGVTLAWWQRPRDVKFAASFAGCTILLAWTHYLAVLFACTCGAAMLLLPRKMLGPARDIPRPSVAMIGLVIAISTVGCLPLVPPLMRLRDWSPFMELQSIAPNLADIAGPVWLVGVPVLVVVAFLVRLVFSRSDSTAGLGYRPLLVISGGIAVGSLVIFLAFGIVGPHSLATNPRYQVAFTVALSLFLAASARQLTAGLKHSIPVSVCVVFMAVTVTWITFGKSPLIPTRLATTTAVEWRQASAIVSERSQDGDLLLVQSGLVESFLVPTLFDDPLFMEYVACRMGKFYVPQPRTRLALPFFWSRARDMNAFFRDQFDRTKAADQSVWIAAATDTDIMEKSLEDTRRLLKQCGWEPVFSDAKPAMVVEKYQYPADTSAADRSQPDGGARP